MKHRRTSLYVALLPLLVLLLAACTGIEYEPAAQPGDQPQTGVTVERPTKESAEATASPEALPAETQVLPTPTKVGEGPMQLTPTAPPAPTKVPCASVCPTPVPRTAPPTGSSVTPTPLPALPGIVYETEEGLWLVGSDGQPALLTSRRGTLLSPAGDQLLYIEDGDVYVMGVDGGEPRNVTAGSGYQQVNAQWWPARPNTLILGARTGEDEGPNSGRLALVDIDGSNYRIANEAGELSNAQPAPSPDGKTIAYDEAGHAMLYHVDEGVQPFDPHAYDLPEGVTVERIASPAWSPDGSKLAWVMAVTGGGYGNENGWDVVLAVFDLQAQTSTLLLPFEPVGRGGWFEPPVWSADGELLTFFVESPDKTKHGLWVTMPNGDMRSRVWSGSAGDVAFHASTPLIGVWSPPIPPWHEKNYLLYGELDLEEQITYFLVGEDYGAKITLPAGALLRDWLPLE